MAGYSGTPLTKKIGIKEGSELLLLGAPSTYLPLLDPLPAGVKVVSRLTDATDIVHVFATRRAELEKELVRLRLSAKSCADVNGRDGSSGALERALVR